MSAVHAPGLGATAILDWVSGSVPDELRERTDGIGVDVDVECAGNARALDDCVIPYENFYYDPSTASVPPAGRFSACSTACSPSDIIP